MSTPRGRRIAVAVSGSGRSLANLMEAQASGAPFEIAAVIASRHDCKAVDIAGTHELPLFVENFAPERLADVGGRMYRWLAEQRVDWVALAGFLKRFPLSPVLHRRVVNIHPALLPKFGGAGMYGERVHAAVLAAGEKESGATVHFVDERYDEGPVIAQVTVAVHPLDDVQQLAARVFKAESALYPVVLAGLVNGTLPQPNSAIMRMTYDP